MHPHGNSAASIERRTASTTFLKTVVIEFFSREVADHAMSECLER